MTAYRRLSLPGASYFFTVALSDRGSALLIDKIEDLRRAVALTIQERPFRCDAAVVLPEHLHMVWTLPPEDADFSTRWRLIKSRFSRFTEIRKPLGPSQARKHERGVWQRRFWEHCIRDEADFAAHVRYCWGNPVRHGYVTHAMDWPYSSIHRDRLRGKLPAEWADSRDGYFGEP